MEEQQQSRCAMPFGNERVVDFEAMSPGEVESGNSIYLLQPEDGEDGAVRTTNQQDPWRAACWTLCSATAVYSTKRLMTTHGYHYPLTICFHTFLAILLTYTIALYVGSKSTHTKNSWGIQRSRPDNIYPNLTWLVMIPASLAAGASLPMFLEGLLHMPSLAVLVLLFPVSYAAEAVLLFICCSPARSQKWLPWETFVVVGASAAVLFNEYRLMVPGLIWGVTGVLFIGVTRALFVIGSERCGSELDVERKLNSYHGFVVMSLVFGVIISMFSGWFVEAIDRAYSFDLSTLGLMVLNTACMVGTAFTGTTLLAYSPISFADARPGFVNIPLSMTDYFTSSASSILVIIVAIHSSPITVVSWLQIAFSMISSSFLLGSAQLHTMVLIAMDSTQHLTHLSPTETRKPSRIVTSAAWFLLIVIFSWSISTLSSLSVYSIPPSPAAILDTTYKPTSRFDIVVSMYDESPTSVKSMLNSLKQSTLLSTLTPNIIIYTKDAHANTSALQDLTGANKVEILPNLGREGGTYLHHIVSHWDSLAEQTMFIQAHAHNMRELLPRINDYLVPETGMLSLGFTGVVTTCLTAEDRWGWSDGFDIIPDLYHTIYRTPCTPSTSVLLSYKGQFVASARRIRGVEKKVYRGLLKAITSEEGWSHDSYIVGERVDTSDNPFFGFTVERIWGLLLQCASDGVVAAKCPSLLSGMGVGGRVEDCQCLDKQRGKRR